MEIIDKGVAIITQSNIACNLLSPAAPAAACIFAIITGRY
jgi:hypothetical protein